MAGTKPRSTREAVDRARALAALVRHAHGEARDASSLRPSPRESELLALPASAWNEQEVLDAVWRGEALGTILWALQAADELPPYDTPFDHALVARWLEPADVELRPSGELESAREAARLWHWRARTAILEREGRVELPERWKSYRQIVAVAAMRGHEQGLLPEPRRGDFPAFGRVYRELTDEQQLLALSIAAERHFALNWLCGEGEEWDVTPTDT